MSIVILKSVEEIESIQENMPDSLIAKDKESIEKNDLTDENMNNVAHQILDENNNNINNNSTSSSESFTEINENDNSTTADSNNNSLKFVKIETENHLEKCSNQSDLNHLNSHENNTSEDPSITQRNNNNNEGLTLQKIVLEDINLDDCIDLTEQTEEITQRTYKFQITSDELKQMIENSILDFSANRACRYLTGNFIKIFERHAEQIEKLPILIQKRNNIIYEESIRNNTVYMRVNGDCKLCPKTNRVKYVFTIKQKPNLEDKMVDVEARCRGIHNHHHHQHHHNHFHLHNHVSSHVQDTSGNMLNNNCAKNSVKYNKRLRLSSGNDRYQTGIASLTSNHTTTTTQTASSLLTKSCGSSFNERLVILAKKRKFHDDENNFSNQHNSLLNSCINTNSLNSSRNDNSTTSSSSIDRNLINQLATQISNKVMIKLDQINFKINQINDRLYNLEKKFETIEVTELL
jgi:hypothetical protein